VVPHGTLAERSGVQPSLRAATAKCREHVWVMGDRTRAKEQRVPRLLGDRTRKISSRHAYFDAVAEVGFDEISRTALIIENFQPAITIY
jgi:hypothetical protein